MNTPIVPDNKFKMWADPRFQILAEVDKLLDGSRVWGGTGWVYHPIDPAKYLPVSEKVREALDLVIKEYEVEE